MRSALAMRSVRLMAASRGIYGWAGVDARRLWRFSESLGYSALSVGERG